MVIYIHRENCEQNLTSGAYLETCKHLRRSFMRKQVTAEVVNRFHKKNPSQKFVDFNYASLLRQLNNLNSTDCS